MGRLGQRFDQPQWALFAPADQPAAANWLKAKQLANLLHD